MQEKLHQRILDQIKPEDTVIDVGCGYGRFLKKYREKYPVQSPSPKHTCHGIDINDDALEKCSADILEFYGYACNFPLDTPTKLFAQFDVVVALNLIDQEEIDRPDKAVLGLAKLCKNSQSICCLTIDEIAMQPYELDELLSQYFNYVQILIDREERTIFAYCTDKVDTSGFDLHG